MKLASFVTFVLFSLLLTSFFEVSMAGSDFCNMKCDERCSEAGERKRCLEDCGICCEQCMCVPPGTYGNKDDCPCYRDIKNSKAESKCP